MVRSKVCAARETMRSSFYVVCSGLEQCTPEVVEILDCLYFLNASRMIDTLAMKQPPHFSDRNYHSL